MTTFNVYDLVDPHIISARCSSVHVIDDSLKPNIEVGQYVKLMRNGAYFWVHIKEIDGTTVTAEIYHPVSCNAKFSVGDLIVFDICYVFDVYDSIILGKYPRMDQIIGD